jgi:hypothetical protein
MHALNMFVVIALLSALWLLLALPFIVVIALRWKSLKRRGLASRPVALVYATLASLLLTPTPTSIITIFFPHGWLLVSPGYYRDLLGISGPPDPIKYPWLSSSTSGHWPWLPTFFCATAVVCVSAAWVWSARKSGDAADSTDATVDVRHLTEPS